jgi:hypothetical protein
MGSVVVDVGGGVGSQTAVLAKAFDHIKFVVQDRPTVIEDSAASVRCFYGSHFTLLIIISVLEESRFNSIQVGSSGLTMYVSLLPVMAHL